MVRNNFYKQIKIRNKKGMGNLDRKFIVIQALLIFPYNLDRMMWPWLSQCVLEWYSVYSWYLEGQQRFKIEKVMQEMSDH